MKEEEVFKLAIIALIIWVLFFKDSSKYAVPQPGPAVLPTSTYRAPVQKYEASPTTVNNQYLLANQSQMNSKTAQNPTLYSSDIRGPPMSEGYKPLKSAAFVNAEGTLGPQYGSVTFNGASPCMDERGCPTIELAPGATAPPSVTDKKYDTSFNVNTVMQRGPQA